MPRPCGRAMPVWALGVLLLCAACGGPTPYGPETGAGGYSDFQLADDVFDVAFRGNEFTPEETVRLSLLYRCAEVTKQRGYQYFAVQEGGYRASTYTTQTSGVYSATTRRSGNQAFTTGTLTPGPTLTSVKYRGLMRIRTFKGGPKPEGAEVYDAGELIRHVGPQLVMAPPAQAK